MLIASASDLHFEHYTMSKNYGLSDAFVFNEAKADVLILAGDIIDSEMIFTERCTDIFAKLAGAYKTVIMVMGNHSHYGGDFGKTEERIQRMFAHYPNLHLLEKRAIMVDGIRFFGGTMWTDFDDADPIVMMNAKRGMNDYSQIMNEAQPVSYKSFDANGAVTFHSRAGRFSPNDALDDHRAFIAALKSDIAARPDQRYVVVTHHSPSYAMQGEYFQGNSLNACYHSHLDDLILDTPQIKAWYFGHTHAKRRLTMGECELILNARGYPGEYSSEYTVALKEI